MRKFNLKKTEKVHVHLPIATICAVMFWASPMRFTIKIKHILFYVFQFNFVHPMNPVSEKSRSIVRLIRLSFIFDYLRVPVKNAPWMSKARQSLTVLWSPILWLPVCACILYLIGQMIYSQLKCILWPFCTMTCLFAYVFIVTKCTRESMYIKRISLYRVLCSATINVGNNSFVYNVYNIIV